MGSKFPTPKEGDCMLVVHRYQRQPARLVQITKVGRLQIHLGTMSIPRRDLADQGVHYGQNEDYWLSQNLYDTHRTNKTLLRQLENHVASLVPHTMQTADIVAAARLLGLDPTTKD